MRSKRLGANPLPKQPYHQLGNVNLQPDTQHNQEEIEQAGDDPLLNLEMMPLEKMTSETVSTPAQEESVGLPSRGPSIPSDIPSESQQLQQNTFQVAVSGGNVAA